MLRRSTVGFVAASLALSLASCAADKSGSESSASGLRVYQEPLSDGNTFACSTCHALAEPTSNGMRRPGHPIADATRRSHWKNGRAASFLEATNSCVTEWMGASAWTESEPRFIALRDFLDAEAGTQPAADLSFAIVEPPTDVSGGDPERGRALFDDTCVVCHGSGGVGTNRGPSIAHSKRAPAYIAERIRKSGNPTSTVYQGLTGGVMPFWAEDRLSDAELRDLIAFIAAPSEQPGPGTGGNGAGDNGNGGNGGVGPGTGGGGTGGAGGADAMAATGGTGGTGTGCTANHARVGWHADLGINTGEGQVRGLVTMVDDCTLELSGFSYDGNGIDVRVYGSKNANFRPGFSIGPDLVGRHFDNDTLRVQLPAGKTLDDLDWVSIWCVAVGANFGSGPFVAR